MAITIIIIGALIQYVFQFINLNKTIKGLIYYFIGIIVGIGFGMLIQENNS